MFDRLHVHMALGAVGYALAAWINVAPRLHGGALAAVVVVSAAAGAATPLVLHRLARRLEASGE